MANSGGLLNSLVGKTLGDDDIDNFIDSYSKGLSRVVARHKALRQGGARGSNTFE